MIHKILISDRSFTPIEEIQDICRNISWTYNLKGGCNSFNFEVPLKYCNDLIFGGNFNIKIYRRNPTTKAYDLWYQGRIENNNNNVRQEIETITISGLGYLSELSDVYIDANFSGQEVSVVVKNLLDNYIVPNTNITYDIGNIETTTFTPDTLTFNSNALDAMQTLADIVGSREWGVDANRKFYFKARSETVGFRLPLADKVRNFVHDTSSKQIINRVIVIGAGDPPFTATYDDLQSQLKWKRRDAVIQNSAITTTQVASQYATAKFSEFNDVSRRARLTLVDERQIESTIPIPLLNIISKQITYGQMTYGTFLYSGLINYQINRINYNMTDEGVLTIDLELGQLRPSVAETLNQLDYQINQLQSAGL